MFTVPGKTNIRKFTHKPDHFFKQCFQGKQKKLKLPALLIFKQMFTTKQQGLTLYKMYIQHKTYGERVGIDDLTLFNQRYIY